MTNSNKGPTFKIIYFTVILISGVSATGYFYFSRYNGVYEAKSISGKVEKSMILLDTKRSKKRAKYLYEWKEGKMKPTEYTVTYDYGPSILDRQGTVYARLYSYGNGVIHSLMDSAFNRVVDTLSMEEFLNSGKEILDYASNQKVTQDSIHLSDTSWLSVSYFENTWPSYAIDVQSKDEKKCLTLYSEASDQIVDGKTYTFNYIRLNQQNRINGIRDEDGNYIWRSKLGWYKEALFYAKLFAIITLPFLIIAFLSLRYGWKTA